jgi:hypothetical protein
LSSNFLVGASFSSSESWEDKNGAQQEDILIPATSMALQTHSGTSPLGNYKTTTI